MHNTRVRRANDAVLTEMARSLLREDRPVEDASAGRSAAAQAERLLHTGRRFRRGLDVHPPTARHRPRPLAAPPA